MSIDPEGYFDNLDSYLNQELYGLPQGRNDIILKEKVCTENKPKTYKVTLKYTGRLFAIKLDAKPKGRQAPLFHFLDNTAKPWSKRCDFVLFNYKSRKIRVFLIEFKHTTINGDGIFKQLKASQSWCQSLV